MSRQKLFRVVEIMGWKCKKIPKFTHASIPLPVADARSFSRGSFWAGRTLFCDDNDVIESISVHRQKLGVWFRFIHVFKSKTIADDAHNSHSQDTRFRARISNTRGDHFRQQKNKSFHPKDIHFRARISNTRGDHLRQQKNKSIYPKAVSYTHLTLPTILRV